MEDVWLHIANDVTETEGAEVCRWIFLRGGVGEVELPAHKKMQRFAINYESSALP